MLGDAFGFYPAYATQAGCLSQLTHQRLETHRGRRTVQEQIQSPRLLQVAFHVDENVAAEHDVSSVALQCDRLLCEA